MPTDGRNTYNSTKKNPEKPTKQENKKKAEVLEIKILTIPNYFKRIAQNTTKDAI